METRRLTLEVDGQGNVKISQDDFTAAEMASFALIVHDLAIGVLKNGPQPSLQISSPRDSDGIR